MIAYLSLTSAAVADAALATDRDQGNCSAWSSPRWPRRSGRHGG
jgi:hypothetical protein